MHAGIMTAWDAHAKNGGCTRLLPLIASDLRSGILRTVSHLFPRLCPHHSHCFRLRRPYTLGGFHAQELSAWQHPAHPLPSARLTAGRACRAVAARTADRRRVARPAPAPCPPPPPTRESKTAFIDFAPISRPVIAVLINRLSTLIFWRIFHLIGNF